MHRVHQRAQLRPHLLRAPAVAAPVRLRPRQVHQVRPLAPVEAQGPRECVQDLDRHVVPVALLQARVVRDRHPRQLRQFLPAQPGHAPAAPVVGQTHVLGAQPRTAGAEELAEAGSLIKLVHPVSIPGRHTPVQA